MRGEIWRLLKHTYVEMGHHTVVVLKLERAEGVADVEGKLAVVVVGVAPSNKQQIEAVDKQQQQQRAANLQQWQVGPVDESRQ